MSSPTPSPQATRAMAERAISWLYQHREYGSLPADASADLTDPNSTYKPLGESALAASLVLREGVATPRARQRAHSLLDFAWQALGGGDLLYQRQLRHPLFTDPLELYTHFARAGYRHEALEALLSHLGSLLSHQGVEHVPNRRLAVANGARVAGLEYATDWTALVEASWLGHTPEPWAMDWMTAYCMTHTVFHVTDWGAHPADLGPRTTEYLCAWLPVWMEVWAETQEWDLLAELAIVDACLPEPTWTPHIWERLAALQQPDGLVPINGEPVSDDPAEAFVDHHHTTVVAAVAATLALSRTSRDTRTSGVLG